MGIDSAAELKKLVRSVAQTARAIRLEKGLTQQEVAEKMGMLQGSIAKFESGKQNPTFQSIFEMSQVLGVDMSKFFITALGNPSSVELGPESSGWVKIRNAINSLPSVEREWLAGVLAQILEDPLRKQ